MGKDLIALDPVRVNQERLRRAWSRKKLAAEAGLSVVPVMKAVEGQAVALRTAAAVARALGLRVKDVVVLPEAAAHAAAV